MPRPFAMIALALATAVTAATVVAAQAPRISNGTVTAQPAATPLTRSFQSLVASQDGVAWIGYSVPALPKEGTMCCAGSGNTWVSGNIVVSSGDACCTACRIEPGSSTTSTSRSTATPPTGPVKLEGSDTLLVLFRVENRRVERIRMFSEECELDAGGRPVRWLDNVRPAESVTLLESLAPADAEKRDRIASGAIAALAMHAASEAGAALQRMSRQHEAPGIRGESLFWLAQRGDQGADRIILEAIEKDTSADVRKRAVFALSQLADAVAVPALIRVARNDATPTVRGEALFWLGQKAGKKAAAEITERIEQDPDTDVKKRAVFALSQLPKDEGVPLLINVARTNTNPAVRKQAMFWLGQSKDPRAIDFFAEILK